MDRPIFAVVAALAALASAAAAQETKPLVLPAPQKTGGKPLMQALAERRSIREFDARELSPQTLSNLLWAACGVNRPDGRRTAPTASNRQEISVYVVLPGGAYLYNAKEHRLDPAAAGDLRSAAGVQPFVAAAPAVLVYVADFSRVGGGSPEQKESYAAVDTGYVSQNVYLFCASEGMATVVLGSVDKAGLAKKLGLDASRKVMFSQPVGHQSKR